MLSQETRPFLVDRADNSDPVAATLAARSRGEALESSIGEAVMNVTSRRVLFLAAACLLLALGACAGRGGYDATTDAPQTGMRIGPAGGTLSGPNGATVVIPPGALATDMTIAIALTSAGAPALPTGFTAHGPMFAFTPHGSTFAVPVKMTLPFDPASVPAGTTPQFYKTNAQNQWEQVANAAFGADSVTAQVTGSSDDTVVGPPLFRGDPVREWTFSDYRGPSMTKTELSSGRQDGGVFEQFASFGGAFPFGGLFDHEITSIDGTVIPQDGDANGQAFSTADGVTYGVFAEAPWGTANPDTPAGGVVLLRQFQAFIKRSADATLTFTLSSAFIDLRDDNGGFSNNSNVPGCVYPPTQVGSLDACQDLVSGQLTLSVKAYTHASGPATPGRTFFHTTGIANAKGHRGEYSTGAVSSMLSRTPLWSIGDFDVDISPGFNFLFMNFREPRTYTVDLSSIAVGEEFTLNSAALAEATDRPGHKSRGLRELPSAAAAFLRDPLAIGGTTLAFSGLEPTDNPVLEPPAEVPVEPAACVPGPGPDPLAGVIQFSAANYSIDELGGAAQPIRITRTGGSRGAVTATFTTSNGTAIGGSDFTPVTATVFFADGDAEERVAEVSILQNLIDGEPTKTVNLTLSQPGGCAALGSQVTALLSIADDDQPAPPAAFTVGGTVSGLAGTGLVLQDLHFLPITPGNGPFTFPAPTNTGSPYAVTIVSQPINPLQVCTVGNGSGTVANADITDVTVDCVTPPASGALDASFGDAGKVSTAFGGDDSAMALQADGKIVMVGGGFRLARYNADGGLDAGFGAGGLVTTDLPGTTSEQAHGVALQPDGKIVVVGFTFASGRNSDFVVARYNADGGLDASFGVGSKLTVDILGGVDEARNVALRADGAIVVSGIHTIGDDSDLAHTGVVSLDANGNFDTSFGSGGKVTLTDMSVDDGLALADDGRVLLVGSVSVGVFPADSLHFALMRLAVNGSPDSGFGSGGLVTTDLSTGDDFGRAIALQAGGKIVVAGQSLSQTSSGDFAVARYNTDGSLDAAFGSGGKLTIDFFGSSDGAESVAVQPDGKVVLGGFARNVLRTGYALVRVAP